MLLETLASGTNIVCDRYAFSGVTYSAAKGLDFEWCLNADRGLVQPDLVIYIKVSMETIKERSGFGDERYEKTEFQEKVRAQYSKFEDKYKNSSHWVTIEADGKSIEEMEAEIRTVVLSYKGEENVNSQSLFNDY